MTDKETMSDLGISRGRRREGRRGLFGVSATDVDRLLLAAVFVGVLLVIGALGYLVYAAIARPVAPRTDVERRVYYFEQGVKARPDRVDLWESYAAALIDAGQYSRAADVIARGSRLVDDKAGLLVLRARLERLQGRGDDALATADEAIKEVAAFRARYAQKAAREGSGAPLAASTDIVAAEIIKAEIYAERGKTQQAIDAYTRALQEKPTMADVLAARGELHAKLGDREAARKDFREALRYDPENTIARDGLEKLGDITK